MVSSSFNPTGFFRAVVFMVKQLKFYFLSDVLGLKVTALKEYRSYRCCTATQPAFQVGANLWTLNFEPCSIEDTYDSPLFRRETVLDHSRHEPCYSFRPAGRVNACQRQTATWKQRPFKTPVRWTGINQVSKPTKISLPYGSHYFSICAVEVSV